MYAPSLHVIRYVSLLKQADCLIHSFEVAEVKDVMCACVALLFICAQRRKLEKTSRID